MRSRARGYREPPVIEPISYRRWYETPLGVQVDTDEKAVVFALANLKGI